MLLAATMTIAALAVGCGGGDDGDETASSATGSNAASTEADAGSGSADSNSPSSDSSSDSSSSSSSTTADSAFIEEADQICRKAAVAILYYEAPGDPEPSEKVIIEDALVPEFQGVVQDLRGLEVPSDQASQVEEFITALQQDVESIEQSGLSTLGAAEKQLQDSSKLARKYGIKDCAYA